MALQCQQQSFAQCYWCNMQCGMSCWSVVEDGVGGCVSGCNCGLGGCMCGWLFRHFNCNSH
eukprot:4369565-Ditylum_brightwellii.AAC.1